MVVDGDSRPTENIQMPRQINGLKYINSFYDFYILIIELGVWSTKHIHFYKQE